MNELLVICLTINKTRSIFFKYSRHISESHVTVPGAFALPGTQFLFTVSVKNRDSGWIQGTQKINVVKDATIINLE